MQKISYQSYDHRLKALICLKQVIPDLNFNIPKSTVYDWKKNNRCRTILTHDLLSKTEDELVSKLVFAKSENKSLKAKLAFLTKAIELMDWSVKFQRIPEGKNKK